MTAFSVLVISHWFSGECQELIFAISNDTEFLTPPGANVSEIFTMSILMRIVHLFAIFLMGNQKKNINLSSFKRNRIFFLGYSGKIWGSIIDIFKSVESHNTREENLFILRDF